ncbi:hypothetical protein LPB72_07010 [Hydrogenophaga crassostreae]|uniref:Uncharacterized protein n=1 Tax=Hydrogenophaga crassostreae TaxID=1763535 RepID=A0A167IFC5_9BURK|nr:hypothetical protein [Hydrogenophaga crassostreae]AOW13198.1 hypothetical protein LPB072_10365 [Hydrogenophaga crassostreae]OAD42654.1 hypothetical protein LPB72_07010 [Hydrogenophaga crassostreae]
MTYVLKLYVSDDTTLAERDAAHRLFCGALEGALGGPELVWPMYVMHRSIVQQYGEAPDEDDLNAEQRLVFDAWQQAEAAALEAVFGPYRNLDEGGYDISPV